MATSNTEPPPYPGPPSRTEHGEDDLSDDEPPSTRHLAVPHVEGMDDASRRSMEDEERELPPGWIRQYDESSGHQFFVNTAASPPRSIWTHPYDDPDYLQSIPDAQPVQLSHQDPSSSAPSHHESSTVSAAELRERREAQDSRTKEANAEAAEKHENRSLGEKIKDKLTGSTKAERDADKRKRIAAERAYQQKAQEQFLARRQALLKLQQQRRNDPSYDRYYAPSSVRYAPPPLSLYGRSPYSSGGYYGRRGGYYGGGYGGGMGLPLAMGGLGGLGAGMLIGGAMDGGYGGGGFGGGGFGGGGFGGGGFGGGGFGGGGFGGGDMGGGGFGGGGGDMGGGGGGC